MPTPPKLVTLNFALGILLITALDAHGADEWGQCQVWPQPAFTYPDEDRGDLSATIFSADSSESRDNNEVIDLLGDISVQRPTEQLFADKATYNRALKILEASGNIRYETPEFITHADYALIELEGNKGRFENTHYIVSGRHARGSSTRILIESSDLTVLKQASYTTCDPGDEDWMLRASTVELDLASGMGSAWNARLAFQGVPFLYIPYIRFPITDERMTGLLTPIYGSTELGGTELALPIYLNLHPQLDATITPRNYTNRGMKWDNEIRYLTHYGEGRIHSEQLDDRVYGATRTLFQFNHTGKLSDQWYSDVLFSRVSDRDYFNDFGTSLSVSSQTHLERHARLAHNDNYGHLLIQAQDYQAIDDTTPFSSRPYRRLPQINYTLAPQRAGPLRLDMNSELVRFQQQQRLTGTRFNLTPSLSLPYQRPAGFIVPKVSLSHTRYELNEGDNILGVESLERNLPISSLDSGLYLERDMHLFGHDYLQTLEPRLFYLNVPYRDQSNFPLFDSGLYDFNSAQLFRTNRFAGIDRIGDTQQATLALTSRLLRSHDGWEMVRGTIGQIQYFEDRQVALTGNQVDSTTHSETILDAEFRPTRPLSLRGGLFWNSDDNTVTRRDLRLQYMSNEHRIINVGYRMRGNDVTAPAAVTREIDSSILWPVTARWSIIGRHYRSLPNDLTLEKLAGIEYNDCCWAFRAVRRAAFVEDSAITSAPYGTLRYSWYLQLELKGLTSLGDSIDTLMQDKILGYTAVP